MPSSPAIVRGLAELEKAISDRDCYHVRATLADLVEGYSAGVVRSTFSAAE